MDDFDDDPWSRQSPENEKVNALASTSQLKESPATITVSKDDDAWNASLSDNDDDNDTFVEATSRLDTPASPSFHGKPAGFDPDPQASGDFTSSPGPIAGLSLDDVFDKEDEQDGFANNANDDDDFGDFGDPDANAADDDDFGAFDEADTQADFGDGFGAPSSSTNAADATRRNTHLPELPWIDFAEIGTSQEDIWTHIRDYYSILVPGLSSCVDPDRPERQYEDKRQILYSRELQDLHYTLVEKPLEFQPIDWRRSNMRRNMLRSLGVPIDLDDVAPPAKPLAPLVLPSIRTTPASPSLSKTKSGFSAPPSAGVNGSDPSTSRTASPMPGSRQNSIPTIPPVDVEDCQRLVNVKQEELGMMTVQELGAFRDQLQELAVQAGTHLTALLERKETLSGQSETYNAMIQDLVKEAQKLRSSTSPLGRKSSMKRSASGPGVSPTSATGAGRSLFSGSGSTSRPSSRPSSPAFPAPNNNLKTSVGKSSVAAEVNSSSKNGRRTSLW